MRKSHVSQPSLERMIPFQGSTLLVGVIPNQDPIVVRTAADLARATSARVLHCAFVDTKRYVIEEYPDGSVKHGSISPDTYEDWQMVNEQLQQQLEKNLGEQPPVWKFWYLAGRPDRALTHLARAVNASMIILGSHAQGIGAHLHEILESSVAVHLAKHQHRPVLSVPVNVVDWKELKSPW